MPREIAGFYYDAEKNRYFPLRGPIPGSSSSSSINNALKPSSKPTLGTKFCRRSRLRTCKLLQGRELNGDVIGFSKGKCNFKEEVLKNQVTQPMVWKYQGTQKIGDGALDQMHVHIQTPQGEKEVDVLIAGGTNRSLSILEVGKVRQHFEDGTQFFPDRVGPAVQESKAECSTDLGHIWRPGGASLPLSSNISSINLSGKHHSHAVNDGLHIQHGLITTLGSETSGGAVWIFSIQKPLDLYSSISMRQMIRQVTSFSCTIWTADCNQNRSQAVIGTNLGAALLNLETGRSSWICRSKSDVLALQFDQSDNVVLCGLRNGAIVTVDVREKQERSARLVRHGIPYSLLGRSHQISNKHWFKIEGNIDPSCTMYMPSSICSLVALQLYGQYFLASSMDGSIKLYDHRMAKRGPVQSYEGHVNSHTRLQLGVDQSERFLVAGGEDCNLRLWSIKSGELLVDERFCDTAISTVCWQRPERCIRIQDESKSYEEWECGLNNWGAWCGSQEGLFYVNWS